MSDHSRGSSHAHMPPINQNADLDDSELTPRRRAARFSQERENLKQAKEAQDPDQMHLLKPEEFAMEEDKLDQKMNEFDDFPIKIDKRSVGILMERYENKNTRLLIDVNT